MIENKYTDLDYALDCAANDINTDSAREELAQLRATIAQQAARIAELEQAAIHIVGKILKIHESEEYMAVWEFAQSHRGQYRGESYEDELNTLAGLLAAHPSPAEPRTVIDLTEL
jgi:hypothetical protein